MKICRLHVTDFAAIREVDIAFGDGLNVLHGPNDLGKSTLAEAIRLALLLPHTSTHIDEYVPWTGGRNPVVELTFETGTQRFWRVRKEFRRSGAAVLQESKNGVEFDQVEAGRKVDGKLREILQWGIPEPGGSGGSKGLPTSFLATALLSTQSNVSALLSDSLQSDSSGTGKDRIAAALQAVAQDPVFVALLNETQARYDEAFTPKGAKRIAKGSVFKAAADRLKEIRDEKERQQKLVEDSEGVEQQLRDLTVRRNQRESAVAAAADRVKSCEGLAAQATAVAIAAEQVRVAREEVERIQRLGAEVSAAEDAVAALARNVSEAAQALRDAQGRQKDADAARDSAEAAARAAGSGSSAGDTVARQALELRRLAAHKASTEAQLRIDEVRAALTLVDAAESADRDHRQQLAEAQRARTSHEAAAAAEQAAAEHLHRLTLHESALESRAADSSLAAAVAAVGRQASLRARLDTETRERGEAAARRAGIDVPAAALLTTMRRVENDLAGARGALNVGLVVTVTPKGTIDLRVTRDGQVSDATSIREALEIEADSEVDLDFGDAAALRIRGGRRQAQQAVQSLEERWNREVVPHLTAARVTSLDALSARVEEAQALDAGIRTKDAELTSLRDQIAALDGSAESLREASERAKAARLALGDARLDLLLSEIAAIEPEPAFIGGVRVPPDAAALRKRRQESSAAIEAARTTVSRAGTVCALAEERGRIAKAALDAALIAREAAVTAIPGGATAAMSTAQASLAAASAEEKRVTAETAALEATVAAEAARIEAAVGAARAAVERAGAGAESAQRAHVSAITEQASQAGRLEELQKLRRAQDLEGAENRWREAAGRHAALPVPAQMVTDAEVRAARDAESRAKSDLDRIVLDIQRMHGALEQVGGSVARERLRDATDAFESAERDERELEAEYDAWLLLLQQMKEADAAQASNLGQVLAPAIAGRFEALTRKRYENVRLTAHLGTEGVVVAGAVRPTARMSVGTREQLSTLYRLALAEYLQTTVVLDDQLVQSDTDRMDWFRALLLEKARQFQIVVFTCRAGDYLGAAGKAGKGKAGRGDAGNKWITSIDLEREIQRRELPPPASVR